MLAPMRYGWHLLDLAALIKVLWLTVAPTMLASVWQCQEKVYMKFIPKPVYSPTLSRHISSLYNIIHFHADCAQLQELTWTSLCYFNSHRRLGLPTNTLVAIIAFVPHSAQVDLPKSL